MGTYFTGGAACCLPATTWLYGSAAIWSYVTGNINDVGNGGTQALISSAQSMSVGPNKTSITFNGLIDDLAVIIPPNYSVTASYNAASLTTSVVLPPPGKYIVIDPNDGDLDRYMAITDGTHSATLIDTTGPINTQLQSAGFTHQPITSPILLSTLQVMGIADGNGNLQFSLVLVPAVFGHLNFYSVTVQ